MGPFIISSVNVALPAIQKEFNADAVQLSWIATALLLATAVVLVPAGRIADIHGRKRVFAWGLTLFTMASLFAGFAPSVGMLILARVIQGVGTAMFVTTGMAILTSIFPPQKRGRVIGIYVSAVYIGLSVGPFAGGILTQHIGWRSLFFLVTPLGILSVYLTLKYLKGEWADARGETLDVIGSVLYGISILALVYGASILPDINAVYLIAGGVLCLGIFVWHELRVKHPVVEVNLFRENRLFTFSSLAALINYSATFAVAFLLSLYLQYIKGLTAQMAGTVLMAQPIMMAVFSPLAGRWSDRIEPRKLATAGMTLTALGLLLFVFINEATPILWIVGTLVMLGFGFALFSSPNMSAIMGSVEKRFFGIASGTVATMRLLGQMTSMAIAMVVFSIFIGREEISPANYDLFLQSVQVCFTISTILCATGVFFSFSRGKLRE
ncbi:MAG: MFS transporter [Desulfobacterales bacterium]|nr:MFS transporter [Desulfobacterales bacterium]